jgi:hypothetical protein
MAIIPTASLISNVGATNCNKVLLPVHQTNTYTCTCTMHTHTHMHMHTPHTTWYANCTHSASTSNRQ